MCWITLTPSKNKRKAASSDCSSAEIVRVHHSPKPRFSDISVTLPSSMTSTSDDHHHHRHHHLHPHLPENLHMHPHAPLPHGLLQHHRHPHLHALHPLHLHPLTPLHGPGKKVHIEPSPPRPPRRLPHLPPPPPPPSSSGASSTPRCEPIYRTQIVEPAAIRASTVSALRSVQQGRMRGRERVREVRGYEMLGRQAPWDWDCVSSTVGSSGGGGGRRRGKVKGKRKGKGGGKGGGLRYPPFGGVEGWL